jgi:hypothetical protein
MKRVIASIFIIFLVTSYSCSQEKHLSTSQKINDFNYLYSSLKENYPFFGVNMRQNGVDWLNKKDEYIERIKKTKNDSSYIFVLKSIISELNSGHVSFMPIQYYDAYLSIYKKSSETMPKYSTWVEVLESDSIKPKYWAEILENGITQRDSEQDEKKQDKIRQNYSDTIINNKIAVMNILSFNKFKIENDKPKITEFLEKITELEYLIVNIQENSGGATDYWKNNIVAQIVTSPIEYTKYMVIKDGSINRSFYPNSFVKGKVLQKDENLQNIPTELLKNKYYIKYSKDTIFPKDPIHFKGKIYLLVAKPVFSSSEGFAQFCKSTNWATVVGEQTGGDGNGGDPNIISLPESGILLIYPSLVGLNSDGSLNFETKTKPDIEIKANTHEKRLDKLINYLTDKK